MIKRQILLIIFLCVFEGTKAQSVQQIEDRIFKYTSAIAKWDTSYSDDNQYDSLAKANKILLDYLNKVLVKNEVTLLYNFKKLEGTRMQILSSDDKKFRVYSWNVGNQSAAQSYNVLIQYKGLSGSKVKILNDVSKLEEGVVCSGMHYLDLFTIRTKIGNNIYVEIGGNKCAAGLYLFETSAYTIENGKLNDSIKIFKTQTEELNGISFECDRGVENNDCHSFKMSEDKQTLYVPLIKESGEVTDKYLIYKWDGNYYVFDKNAK